MRYKFWYWRVGNVLFFNREAALHYWCYYQRTYYPPEYKEIVRE